MARKGLGRGLNEMFGSNTVKTEEQAKTTSRKTTSKTTAVKTSKENKPIIKEVIKEVVKEVPSVQELSIDDIEPNKGQPRKEFNEDALQELADSIKQYGLIEPIVVTKKDTHYEIIAGERRWRAARIAGVRKVPVVIREYTDQQRMEVALIENIQREDLNPIEEALAYQTLSDEYHMTQDQVADRVSKSRSAVTNSMRLLKLTDEVKQMLIDGMISSGHARCLVTITDPDVQKQCATEIFDEGLSVRETEDLVKNVQSIMTSSSKEKSKPTENKNEAIQAILDQYTENLKNVLGTKVKIKSSNGKKGKIEISYSSADDLERIIHMIQNNNLQ